MNDLSPLSDLVADDLFLDRLGQRADAGTDPLAGLLGALATQADTPLPSRTGRRRIANKHRYLGAFAALAIAASGAGVAAAVSLPDRGPSPADRARIEQKMVESARSSAPSALLTRLGLPRTDGTTSARGLVLARRDDGMIVLLPAAVAAAEVARRGVVAGGVVGDPRVDGGLANGRLANGSTNGNAKGSTNGGSGGTTGGGDTAGDSGGDVTTEAGPTGTPQAGSNGQKGAKGNNGGTKGNPGTRPTPTPTPTSDAIVPESLVSTAPTPKATTRTTAPVKGRSGSTTTSGATGATGTTDTLVAPETTDGSTTP